MAHNKQSLDAFKKQFLADTARPEEGSTRRIRGLGDVVENITEATGIKAAVEYVNGGPCSGCKKRQEALNRAVPFGKDQK